MTRREAARLTWRLARTQRNRGILSGVFSTFVMFVIATVVLLAASLNLAARLAAARAPALVVEALEAGRPRSLSPQRVEELRALPAVRSVRARHFGYMYLAALDANIFVIDTASFSFRERGFFAGRWPQGHDEILLGDGIANALGLALGDAFAVSGAGSPQLLKVVAIAREASSILSNDWLVAEPAVVASLLGTQDAADAALEVYPPTELPLLETRLARMRVRTITRAQQQNFAASMYGRATAFLFWVSAPLLLGLAFYLWLSARSDSGAARENAYLRTLGVSSGVVLLIRAVSDSLAIWLGSSLGFSLALLHLHLWDAPLLRATIFSGTLPLRFPLGMSSLEIVLYVFTIPAFAMLLSMWSHAASLVRAPFEVLRTGSKSA